MTQSATQSDKEQLTALVYGDTFSLYDEQTFDEFVRPLYARLEANGIDTAVFGGKRCLDAGCGGGRGSILMAQCGAAEVVAADLSAKNIESTRRRAKQKGLSNVKVRQCSLLDLDLGDAEFDVVWCNGVLHHTADPDKGLAEITRVLKPGGHLWLYLYGSGGLYWHVMYWIRGILSGVDLQQCILLLRLMGAPIRRIAEWIDDWFVPYLRAYTAEDVTSRLRELGYDNAEVLRRGVHYDTSQRRVDASSIEMDLMGQGDLRFFCTKVGAPKGALHKLPDPPGGRGSSYAEKPAVLQVDKPLARIESGLGKLQASGAFDARTCKILVSRAVHEKVRDLLESEGPADVPGFLTHLSALGDLLDGMTHLPGRRA